MVISIIDRKEVIDIKLQYNYTTNKPYLGSNQAVLMSEKDKNRYNADSWITFVQARIAGYKLTNAKGKGVGLRTFITEVDEKGEEIHKPYHFIVFNSDLIEKRS